MTPVTVTTLNTVVIRTVCPANSGYTSYSNAICALFLDAGNELAINNPCAVTPSRPRIYISANANAGAMSNLLIQLNNNVQFIIFRLIKATCAPRANKAIGKNEALTPKKGIQINVGMGIRSEEHTSELQS